MKSCTSKRQAALILVLLSLWAGWITTSVVRAERQEPRAVSHLYSSVESLLLEYYPGATCIKTSESFQCRFKTRTFMIHHPLKTGEWQEARAQEGPNRGGILCTISWAPGRYIGAAAVPQTFDYRYFSSLLMAPYNKTIDTHLIAHLDYPSNAPPNMVQRYQELIAAFARN